LRITSATNWRDSSASSCRPSCATAVEVDALHVLGPSVAASLTARNLGQVGGFFPKRGAVRGSAI